MTVLSIKAFSGVLRSAVMSGRVLGIALVYALPLPVESMEWMFEVLVKSYQKSREPIATTAVPYE